MEAGSQNDAISSSFRELFGSLFVTFSENRFFDAFWSPFGSLLAFPRLLFDSLLASFWCPLARLCSSWGPFSHFWRLPAFVCSRAPCFRTVRFFMTSNLEMHVISGRPCSSWVAGALIRVVRLSASASKKCWTLKCAIRLPWI